MGSTAAERKALSLDLMSEAIAELKKHLSHYILGTVLLSLPSLVMIGAFVWKWFSSDFSMETLPRWAGIWAFVFALTFNQFLYGACRSAQKSLAGQKVSFADFVSFAPRAMGPVLLANLVTAMSLVAGLGVFLVGGLVTSALFFLALPAASCGDLDGLGALRWSWGRLKRDLLTAFAICNVVHLAAVSGIFIFCIGGVATMALYPIAQAILYCRIKALDASLAGATSSLSTTNV